MRHYPRLRAIRAAKRDIQAFGGGVDLGNDDSTAIESLQDNPEFPAGEQSSNPSAADQMASERRREGAAEHNSMPLTAIPAGVVLHHGTAAANEFIWPAGWDDPCPWGNQCSSMRGHNYPDHQHQSPAYFSEMNNSSSGYANAQHSPEHTDIMLQNGTPRVLSYKVKQRIPKILDVPPSGSQQYDTFAKLMHGLGIDLTYRPEWPDDMGNEGGILYKQMGINGIISRGSAMTGEREIMLFSPSIWLEPVEHLRQGNTKPPEQIYWNGLSIILENPKGSIRQGTDQDGTHWEVKMQDHYGFIKNTKGEDGEGVDVFINPDAPEHFDNFSGQIYVVQQEVGGKYDEDKVMIGYPSSKAAETAYYRNYADGWDGLGEMVELSDVDFINDYIAERWHAKPKYKKSAQVNSLNDLTQGVSGPIGPHSEIDDAHRDENLSEDVDLHMASVEAPYSDGAGPLATEFEEETDEVKVVHAMEHKIGRGLDPYKMGRIYSYDQLLEQHQVEVDINDALGDDRSSYYWLRTAMPVNLLVEESKQWYLKNINKKWRLEDRERVLDLAERFMKGAKCTPVLVSAPGERNGGLWEGFHRVRAHALMAIHTCPVVMKIDPADKMWRERIAQFEREPWVCVDFDGTLVDDEHDAASLEKAKPFAGAPEAMAAMIENGFRVTIFTARDPGPHSGNDWEKALKKWLKKWNIKYTDIYNSTPDMGGKPPADVFIDNNAVQFNGNWDQALSSTVQLVREHRAAGLIGTGDNMADSYTNIDGQRDDLAISRDDLSELDVKTARRK